MFEPLEINSEGAVELSDGAGENHASPCGAFLHDREAVRCGEFLYLLDIVRVGAELLREILALDVLRLPAGAVELLHSISKAPPRDAAARRSLRAARPDRPCRAIAHL